MVLKTNNKMFVTFTINTLKWFRNIQKQSIHV